MGIGTTQVRDVLATQTLAMLPLKVRNVRVEGTLRPGVTAKDVALYIIGKLGADGGLGYAYEFGGSAIEAMEMDGRFTLCNMAIEGAARCGYVNPDAKTFAYLKGRPYAPKGEAWDAAVERWQSFASDADADSAKGVPSTVSRMEVGAVDRHFPPCPAPSSRPGTGHVGFSPLVHAP